MSQVFVAVVIVYGSILNLISMPWSSTLSVLERRRNSTVTLFLLFAFFCIVLTTVVLGLRGIGTKDDTGINFEEKYEIQDWVTILLPLLLASTFIMETVTTLVRQIEMIQWVRRTLAHTLPISWMFRTMTIKEDDSDGEWLRSKRWAPWEYEAHDENLLTSKYFFECTSRDSSLFMLFRRWLKVIKSAVKHIWTELRSGSKPVGHVVGSEQEGQSRSMGRSFLFYFINGFYLLILLAMCVGNYIVLVASSPEYALLIMFDYIWWISYYIEPIIITRYDAMYLGREEMQEIFETTKTVERGISQTELENTERVLNRVMSAVLTTASVYENAFRKAYLVTPVYKRSISNRAAMRTKYEEIGCDPDRLILRVRAILEKRHSSGLLSITDSTTSTIEATLHDNIEAVLTVTLFFPTGTLYRIAARIADIEYEIEGRINGSSYTEEMRLREQAVYIDARNSMFWLLWILATDRWRTQSDCIENSTDGETDQREYERNNTIIPDEEVEVLYIIATFLSRCRNCNFYGFSGEKDHYLEVQRLSKTHRFADITAKFEEISIILKSHRNFTLFDWLEEEYKMSWITKTDLSSLYCIWDAEPGVQQRGIVSIIPPEFTSEYFEA